MSKEDVIAKAKELSGRRAKPKACSDLPDGTKARKLPKDVRAGLEDHFGVKLAKVRVHSGGTAPDIAKSLKARAFTYGQDIYFKKAADSRKPEILAHELVHVIQYHKGKMPKKAKPGRVLVGKK